MLSSPREKTRFVIVNMFQHNRNYYLQHHSVYFLSKPFGFLVDGGWGNWITLSVETCEIDPDSDVKQIRLCDNPPARYGGDSCPNPTNNEQFIPCNQTNYRGEI